MPTRTGISLRNTAVTTVMTETPRCFLEPPKRAISVTRTVTTGWMSLPLRRPGGFWTLTRIDTARALPCSPAVHLTGMWQSMGIVMTLTPAFTLAP